MFSHVLSLFVPIHLYDIKGESVPALTAPSIFALARPNVTAKTFNLRISAAASVFSGGKVGQLL